MIRRYLDNMNEEQLLKARLKDLAFKSYKQNIYTYSSFLTPAELMTLDSMREELKYVDYETYGGAFLCERQMVRFGSEASLGYAGEWPIRIVKVEPLIEKFSDELSHRDFLGALMNLGIERSVLGDIIVKDGKRAYVFCQDSISAFMIEHLTKIKHTNVRCSLVDKDTDMGDLTPNLVDISCIVSAPRFDAVIAVLAKCSRSEAVRLFQNGKVTLNGRQCENNSMQLTEGDIFSVRGYGKYQYCGSGAETRKGRIYIHLKQYN